MRRKVFGINDALAYFFGRMQRYATRRFGLLFPMLNAKTFYREMPQGREKDRCRIRSTQVAQATADIGLLMFRYVL